MLEILTFSDVFLLSIFCKQLSIAVFADACCMMGTLIICLLTYAMLFFNKFSATVFNIVTILLNLCKNFSRQIAISFLDGLAKNC